MNEKRLATKMNSDIKSYKEMGLIYSEVWM